MPKPAVLRRERRFNQPLSVLDKLIDRCPGHLSADAVMRCPTCGRRLAEHMGAVERAEKLGKIPPVPGGRIFRS